MSATRFINITAAETYTVATPMIRKVTVNTGDAGASLLLETGGVAIATIDCSNPSIDRDFLLPVDGFVATVTGNPDITIIYQ